MFKVQQYHDIIAIVLAISFAFVTWTTDISLENQFIPTVLNGLTSCISLILGFTATSLAIAISNFKLSQDQSRIRITLFILIFPILFLFNAYIQLMNADYRPALKFAIIGLSTSVIILIDFTFFLTSKIKTKKEDKVS